MYLIDIGMRFTWFSSKLSLIAAYIVESLFGPFMVHHMLIFKQNPTKRAPDFNKA